MPATVTRVLVVCLAVGCGGTLTSGDSDSGDGAASQDGLSNGDSGDGGWTVCTSPSGQQICDGPHACSPAGCECPKLGKESPSAVHVCINSTGYLNSTLCPYVDDGFICVAPYDTSPDFFGGAEYDMGVLFAENGAVDRARYADYGLWTGDPLPNPGSCPTLTSVQICGGNCGGCNGNFVCHGRSPLHPYGFCLPNSGNDACNIAKNVPCSGAGNKCFAYTVQPSAQDLANANSICLPVDMCQDLAANLPGGAVCQ